MTRRRRVGWRRIIGGRGGPVALGPASSRSLRPPAGRALPPEQHLRRDQVSPAPGQRVVAALSAELPRAPRCLAPRRRRESWCPGAKRWALLFLPSPPLPYLTPCRVPTPHPVPGRPCGVQPPLSDSSWSHAEAKGAES